jgi:AbrB family looped-hinge helix DNA binding protein
MCDLYSKVYFLKRATIVFRNTFLNFLMNSVAISPKFQIVIPRDIRRAFNLLAGQRIDVRTNGNVIELKPQTPMTALRGLCPGINTDVPNDTETGSWPGGCEPLLEEPSQPSKKPRI